MTISTVTSEALQLKIRQLLPSQQGFGTDLSASDTIIPIIDLTAAAEGSDVPEYLQTALAFGSQTTFQTENTTTTLANSPGFYRIIGTSSITSSSTTNRGRFNIVGTSTKQIWSHETAGVSAGESTAVVSFDFVVFLNASEQVDVNSDSVNSRICGSFRQVADVNGTLVQPVGFNPQ